MNFTPTALSLLIALPLFSQKQANNWYFGEQAGLTFERNSPIPLQDGNMITLGAAAVVSDKATGELLFYSNGEQAWNRNHQVMPNGYDLKGNNESTNTSYAVPMPGSEGKYYLFTLESADYQTQRGATVYYSIVDINLSAGLGDVETKGKNSLLEEDVSEKIEIITNSNGEDFWLVLHELDNNNFLVYAITALGISTPLTHSIGAVHQKTPSMTEAQGHMKSSPDGTKLAVTLRGAGQDAMALRPFQIFDFDMAAGTISNPITIGEFGVQYGVSFSPDSKKLYLNAADEGLTDFDVLWQFDLTAPDIPTSRVGMMYENPALSHILKAGPARLFNFSMQLGPDGRLYTSNAPDNRVGNALIVINYPNEKGWAAGVQVKEFDFGEGRRPIIDLPNFIQSTFAGLTPDENPNTPCETGEFTLFPNPTDDKLFIRASERCSSHYRLRLFDTLGRILNQFELSESELELDVSALAQGLYLIEVVSGPNSVVLKWVKV